MRLLERRGHLFAILIVLLGLGLRLTSKLTYWFNPDEGINYSLVTHPTFARCWEELTVNSHPFGISVVVWLLGRISFDPTWLRMEALVFGVAAIYLTWLAGRSLGGVLCGLVAALLVAISPAAIEQSQALRPYMMHIAFLAGTLWGLSTWLQHRRGLVTFSVFLTLAVITQFSSFFIVGVIGLLLLGHLFIKRIQPPELLPLSLAFLAPAVGMAFLYFFHIGPHLLGAEIQEDAQDNWLAPFFITNLAHAWGTLLALQRYLFGLWFAGPMVLILLVSLAYGLWCRRAIAWLTLTMLVVAMAISSLSLYPFGGTRHGCYLLLFEGLLIGDCIAILAHKGRRPLLITLLAAAGLLAAGGPTGTILDNRYTRGGLPSEHALTRHHWQDCEELLDNIAETEGVIITTLQSYYTLLPKLNLHQRPEWAFDDLSRRSRWGKCRVFATRSWDATIHPVQRGKNKHLGTFLRAIDKRYEDFDLKRDQRFWLILAGWSTNEYAELMQLQQLVGTQPRIILQLKAYPGFAAVQVQTGPFLATVDRLGR